MVKKKPVSVSFDDFRARLKLKSLIERAELAKKHPRATKILRDKDLDLGKLREHSAKVLSAGALTGALLLAPTETTKVLPAPDEIIEKVKSSQKESGQSSQEMLKEALATILPIRPQPLSVSQEKLLSVIVKDIAGIDAKATLEGEHLNTSYGYIGAEQHLIRYPGDTLSAHGTGEVLREGIAPGLGAWGYFAPSRDRLTPDLVETEKWYAVVQTLYLPEWGRRQPYLRDWYKYRKVVAVNTENGKAVVAAIADAGPAAWTGKHFGGSPEVMDYLGGPRYKKGPVLIFFVDDPENKIPLGPVEYNKISSEVAVGKGERI